MLIPNMYINPALVIMVCTMLTAFVLVGGLLWKLASRLTGIEINIENLSAQFNKHIADCPPSVRLRAQKTGD